MCGICGIVSASPLDISGALNKIIHNYDEMSQNALRCYRERYEITPHFAKVIDLLRDLESNRQRRKMTAGKGHA